MSRTRTFVALLVVALLATAAPAGAATGDPRAARDAARTRKAQAAAQLNALKASERELLAAARVIDDQVLAEAARVDAARRAVQVAEAELAEATSALDETRTARDRLTELFVRRAVEQFISPRPGPAEVGTTRDLAAEARRQALLDSVAASDDDLKDQLDAAEEDYQIQQAAAADARTKAQARRADTEAKLAALERTQQAQRRLRAAVTARQREVLAEISAQSRAESELTRIINSRSQQVGDTSARSSGCIWPVRGRVTSEYGRRWGRLHAGIDIGASSGTPIWASKAGTVIFAGRQSGYGNVVIIDHGGGLTTLYGHQSRIATRDGASVSQGQTIGYVGSTGHSTGPHVHFETRIGGSPRNPRGCLS